MGEVAEMMLDGTMCSSCGEYLGSDAGYPIQCESCGGEPFEDIPFDGVIFYPDNRRPYERKFKCKDCKKRFRCQHDFDQHNRDKHGGHASYAKTSTD